MPPTLDDMARIQRAMEDVSNEIDWVFNNKGPYPVDRLRAFRILAEEILESALEVVRALPNGSEENLRKELIQVASTATIWAARLM